MEKLTRWLVLVTPLQARTFAVWTLTSAIVRAYAAYHIHDKTFVRPKPESPAGITLTPSIARTYDMAMLTYLIAFGHFSSEWLIFRSAKFGAGLLGPIIVSSK